MPRAAATPSSSLFCLIVAEVRGVERGVERGELVCEGKGGQGQGWTYFESTRKEDHRGRHKKIKNGKVVQHFRVAVVRVEGSEEKRKDHLPHTRTPSTGRLMCGRIHIQGTLKVGSAHSTCKSPSTGRKRQHVCSPLC